VVANAEMRFLWLGLATAILVGTVVVMQRQKQAEFARSKAAEECLPDTAQSCSCEHHG